MPKSIGFIYCIEHRNRKDTPIYYGSTTNLQEREKQHRYNCCNANYKKYNYYVYQFIRDYGGWEKWKMKKLHEVLFNEKKELKQIERLYIENHTKSGKKCLNQSMPNRTKKEWVNDNPDRMNNINIQSRLRNREKQNEYRRLHYYKNKDRIIKHNKEYYQKNKENIEKNRSKMWRCVCGAEVKLRNRTHHLKTKSHHDKFKCVLIAGINKI